MISDYFVTKDSTPLYYSILGVGSNYLFLLHGGLGNSSEMALLLKDLTIEDYSAVLLDFRGHGKSFHGNIKEEEFVMLYHEIQFTDQYLFSDLKHGELVTALGELSFGCVHHLSNML
jgi:pimeloyl-ACP methyl ester carboxylesterase